MNHAIRMFFYIIIFISISLQISAQSFELIKSCEIITDLGFTQGCAWGDYDNDGYLDLYVTNSWTNGDNLFYHNTGNASFTRITDGKIANDGGNSNGCTWGDYNNDGYLDLFVANVNDQNNFLYRNNKDGTFTKEINDIVSTTAGWSYGCAWGDYDNDGFIDLYVANYKDQQNFLFHNNQDGSFSTIDSGNIITDVGYSQGCVWSDLNNDGFVDLYVSNKGKNCLYANNKDGTFTKILSGAIVNDNGNSFGCSVADYNNDGLSDIFVANWNGVNYLYKNTGNFVFEKISKGEIVNTSANTEGTAWSDYDNDGDLDLFLTNDGINSLYENNGDETFENITEMNILIDGENSNGTSWADYDNDGDLDLLIVNGGNQTNLLYENTGNSNNWINIKCVGTQSNVSAIGAKVAVLSTIYGENKWMYQEILSQTGGGYGAQNSMNVEFGLGDAQIIDSIIIRWPSGNIYYDSNIEANSFVTITETSDTNIISKPDEILNELNIYPNPFNESNTIEVSLKSQGCTLKIYDIQGNFVKSLLNELSYPGYYKLQLKKEDFHQEGVYFCVFKTQKNTIVEKIIYFK